MQYEIPSWDWGGGEMGMDSARFRAQKLLSLSLRDTWVHDIVAIFLLPSLHIIANIFLSSSYFFFVRTSEVASAGCMSVYVCMQEIDTLRGGEVRGYYTCFLSSTL